MKVQKSYFIENKEITNKANEIKRIIRGSMNGVTVESMEQKGIYYKENFGVALPRLREIAKQYDPNMQLATQLWYLNIRESMIIGSLLVPPNEMNTAIAIQWCEQIPTNELSEIVAMTLFSRLPDATSFIATALDNSKDIVFFTAISTATRISEQLPNDLIKAITLKINNSEQFSFASANAIAIFLTRLANDNSKHIKLVEEVIATLNKQAEPYSHFIFEYVTKELEYLKQF